MGENNLRESRYRGLEGTKKSQISNGADMDRQRRNEKKNKKNRGGRGWRGGTVNCLCDKKNVCDPVRIYCGQIGARSACSERLYDNRLGKIGTRELRIETNTYLAGLERNRRRSFGLIEMGKKIWVKIAGRAGPTSVRGCGKKRKGTRVVG